MRVQRSRITTVLTSGLTLGLWLFGAGLLGAQQASGTIEGRVLTGDGSGLPGVTVTLAGPARGTPATDTPGPSRVTDEDGGFRFEELAPGSYTLRFALGEKADTRSVEVSAGHLTRVEQALDWQRVYVEQLEVYSASRRTERIVEAPAAVSVIPGEQIAREASHGQLPKLLEAAPGAEVVQNGLYDFNLNSRGFNSSFNRRVLTLVDGRDVSAVFIGNQEWATSLAGAPDLLANVEMIRGPGSALYDADAYNGSRPRCFPRSTPTTRASSASSNTI